ncbi:MAG: PDZ domain-containing protein [Gemmatimonadales bacterium]
MKASRGMRRAAAALSIAGLVLGALPAVPALAQSGGGSGAGAGGGRIGRDTGFVRIIMPSAAVRESVFVLVRALDGLQPGSPEFVTRRLQIDSLMRAVMVGHPLAGGAGGGAARAVMMPRGWIGLNLQGLKSEFRGQGRDVVEYLDYPAVVSVDPASPAQRAGIVPGDVVVAYDGMDLRTHRLDLAQILRPEKTVSVTVRRDGEVRDVPIVVARVPDEIIERRDVEAGAVAKRMFREVPVTAMPATPQNFLFIANGWFGVTLTNVNADLARALKLDQGVLVTDAPDGSPGYRAGLRAGDMIVDVEGEPATSVSQLRRVFAMHGGEHAVDVRIIRDKKARKVTLTW